jgi:hypothetical protein
MHATQPIVEIPIETHVDALASAQLAADNDVMSHSERSV